MHGIMPIIDEIDLLRFESDLAREERLVTPPFAFYRGGELETMRLSAAQRAGLIGFLFEDDEL